MVIEPCKIRVDGLEDSVVLRNHPTSDLGTRTISIGDGKLMIPRDDAGGDTGTLWLMGIGNVRVLREGRTLEGRYVDDDTRSGNPKVQWVPEIGSREINIVVPGLLFRDGRYDPQSLSTHQALVEPHWDKVHKDTVVQFVRYGYCKKDSGTQAIFTHK